MLVLDTALRSNVKSVTQFSQTSVLLLQQGGRRHYPATMTSFTSNRTAFSRSKVSEHQLYMVCGNETNYFALARYINELQNTICITKLKTVANK
jgi:hypothetical protein